MIRCTPVADTSRDLAVVPFAAVIQPGEVVNIECVDCVGGQIKNDDSADDVRDADLSCAHFLSGPFEIPGTEPGDILAVEIQDVQPFAERPWGFCAIFDKRNGGGFLDEEYPQAAKGEREVEVEVDRRKRMPLTEGGGGGIAIWDLEGIFCSSRHIPGVRFPGLIHPGIMGCAPSAELLAEWTRRESELVATSELTKSRVVALLPESKSLHAGSATGELKAKIAREGARTIPGRPEHGGNCDIKNLSRGSKTYLPVHIKGRKIHLRLLGMGGVGDWD